VPILVTSSLCYSCNKPYHRQTVAGWRKSIFWSTIQQTSCLPAMPAAPAPAAHAAAHQAAGSAPPCNQPSGPAAWAQGTLTRCADAAHWRPACISSPPHGYIMARAKPSVVLLVTHIEDGIGDGSTVRAYAEQEASSVNVSQQQLDEMIAAGKMPALCMASEAVAAQWSACIARPGVSMEIHLASAPHQKEVAAIAATAAAAQTSEFFEAYANLGVHELMLMDRSRTETYRAAIEDALLRVVSGRAGADGGKGGAASAGNAPVRVLDVGAGTGVLSMFAAKAAAATGIKVEVRCCIRLLL
jgi:hypothetical protein